QKCDSPLIPDLVLGAGEATRRRNERLLGSLCLPKIEFPKQPIPQRNLNYAILGKRLHPAGQSGNANSLRVCRPRLTHSSIWPASVRACVFWIWPVVLGARPSMQRNAWGPVAA